MITYIVLFNPHMLGSRYSPHLRDERTGAKLVRDGPRIQAYIITLQIKGKFSRAMDEEISFWKE